MDDERTENAKSPAAEVDANTTLAPEASPVAETAPEKSAATLAATPSASPATSAAPEQDKHLEELHKNRMHKKGARAVFHLVNFGGLHQLFNNTASVVITYVLATTGMAGKMKDKMGTTAIGKGLSLVLNAPSKAINGIFKLCGADMNKGLNALPEAEREAELTLRKAASSRNAIETAFMTIAGFIALMPVYYLENHRKGFLNKVDNWLHPGRTPKEKEAAALQPGDEPKETLWNLFRARIIALAVVFGVDQVRTNFDSILKFKHTSANKPGMVKNVDTVLGWGLGDKIYKKLPETARSWIARFFSGSLKGDNILLSKIQDETRGDVLRIIKAPEPVLEAGAKIAELGGKIKALGLNPDKSLVAGYKAEIKAIEDGLKAGGHGPIVQQAVFAEQSRLFITKEFLLTTILSVVIYTCTKAPFAAHFMEKIGLAKKGTYDRDHHKGKYARKEDKPESKLPKAEEHAAKSEAAVDAKATQTESKAEEATPAASTGALRSKPEFKPAESHVAAIDQQKAAAAQAPALG